METIEELRAFLDGATADDARGRLLNRGAAWSTIRQDGVLPDDAPALGADIETELAEYGFSILRAALKLREESGPSAVAQKGFERAGRAFESLVQNGDPENAERGFYRIIASTAYHLAGYSAIAYSLLNARRDGQNINAAEFALQCLVLRDMPALRRMTQEWLRNSDHGDDAVTALVEDEEGEAEEALGLILNSTVCRALAWFDFALQTGESALVDAARDLLTVGLRLSGEAGAISLWWIIRLCRSFIGDLWNHSLHQRLPLVSPQGGEESYAGLRQLLIASLYGRKTSEVELWPSQLEAAERSTDITDNLVVALPTSAGKTRIAELAALMTLSTGRRVLIVTPLRALSAQTERSFRRTFAPLGFSVSSLYGASGVSADDQDALRSRNIVIATPEKLDFALRNDTAIINDVGLIILDEGHMIGPTEREIRYETLVQRLLRRADAGDRRIVCLSAILPDGQQLDDLTGWIRHDQPGEAIKCPWRPTRQRFGSLLWTGHAARLNFDLRDGPFIARFIEQQPPRGRQRKPVPRDRKDLTMQAAWKFAEQGKRTLVFVTQANWVEGYGDVALDLVKRGYLPNLLEDSAAIARALEVGREWLGDEHCAVKALQIGVAIHHGGLPNPFLRELELLLSGGVIKVTAASPTLSQGLNLNAAVMLVPTIHRSGALISGEEFANVAGRAGRAFVDVEGLVVHVVYRGEEWRLDLWRQLIRSAKSRTLKSGLIQIVAEIIARFMRQGVLNRDDAIEYLANSREPWNAPDPPDLEDDAEPLTHLVEKLDATVFGLIEALDADAADLPRLLDEALQSSLWARQIGREADNVQQWHKAILQARARLIWNTTSPASRRGHFAMGVGLEAGLALDAMADELGPLIDAADLASIAGDETALGDALVALARRLLILRPFVPDKKNALPENWEALLRAWVTGVDVNTIGTDNMGVVEDAFSYRLVWALEALRTRRVTLGWSPDIIAGGGAASLETGVPSLMMSMLIHAGLPSRQAAMIVVREGGANFFDAATIRAWLESNEIAALTDSGAWPNAATAPLWKRFRDDVLSGGAPQWHVAESRRALAEGQQRPDDGVYRLEIDAQHDGEAWVCTPDWRRLAKLRSRIKDSGDGLFSAVFTEGDNRPLIRRFGPGRAQWIRDEG